MRRWIILMMAVLICGGPAQAADEDRLDALRLRIGNQLRPMTVDVLRDQAIAAFHAADIDGVPGVSQSDYDLARRIEHARWRGQQISQILAHDLDGDGRVSREELRQSFAPQARATFQRGGALIIPTDAQVAAVIDRLTQTALEADSDDDGMITIGEILAHLAAKGTPPYLGRRTDQAAPLSLDSNGDGTVSAEEFNIALTTVLGEIDRDGNGTVTQPEVDAFKQVLVAIRRTVQERMEREQRSAVLAERARICAPTPVPQNAIVALIGTAEGAALSAVAVGDESEETRFAEIDIQEGTQPIYVVATSQAGMIWRFTGSTNRIYAVVIMADASQKPLRVGAIGLDRTRLHFRSSSECLLKLAGDADYARAMEVATGLLQGRTPDVVVTTHRMARARLPVGFATKDYFYAEALPQPEGSAARAVYDELIRTTPAGIVTLDPKAVVASGPVKVYDALPGFAGLMQLVEKGVIEIAEYTQAITIGDAKAIASGKSTLSRTRVPDTYRILGPMTFPANMRRTGRPRFLVARGVTAPLGDAGHARVTCETGGTVPKPGTVCP